MENLVNQASKNLWKRGALTWNVSHVTNDVAAMIISAIMSQMQISVKNFDTQITNVPINTLLSYLCSVQDLKKIPHFHWCMDTPLASQL